MIFVERSLSMTSVTIKDLNGYSSIMKKVLDHGFVELVDHMPQENLDKAIVDGARVSYQTGTKLPEGTVVSFDTSFVIGTLHHSNSWFSNSVSKHHSTSLVSG